MCGLDLVVRRGERVVIVGPNGSGKTTLLSHVLGLLKPSEGKVTVFGKDPYAEFDLIRDRIGVVLQNVDEQLIAPTVEDDITFSPRNRGISEDKCKALAEDVMAKLGITHLRNKVCHYLSGGEKRKVALAGALVMKPDLLVLDEPFEGLDPRSRKALAELLNTLNREWGMAVVMSTHDINLVSQMADYVYVVGKDGGIIIKDTPAELFTRSEYYNESSLDFPILVELFKELSSRGFEVESPSDIINAVDQIAALFDKRKGASDVPD
jgi:cobalt/nickel transport system ATP-binding protein